MTSVSVCSIVLALAAGAPEDPRPSEKPVRTYTNEDLDRVAPYRHEVGVWTVAPAPSVKAAPRKSGQDRATEEWSWRARARKLQDRLRPLREKAETLRIQIAERWGQPAAPLRDPQLEAWKLGLERLEAKIREAEQRFEDAARREGALPGWIR